MYFLLFSTHSTFIGGHSSKFRMLPFLLYSQSVSFSIINISSIYAIQQMHVYCLKFTTTEKLLIHIYIYTYMFVCVSLNVCYIYLYVSTQMNILFSFLSCKKLNLKLLYKINFIFLQSYFFPCSLLIMFSFLLV